jgi:hypothetical protein
VSPVVARPRLPFIADPSTSVLRYQISNPCANVNGLLKGSCVPLDYWTPSKAGRS